ncbi:RusA family crossover junction endodeoxyribonuclease [Devosia sp. WQ 349]|nr:RusA family crossover junction endodeoxyribonuclease [Devosia sp. WQ 349K1]MBK1793276.1 RusA family crossover junction endodeoxyribonuclease [Devosia sp. WQ 349K1]
MWPSLPIEFLVVGTPVSLQSGNSQARAAWRRLVLQAAEAALLDAENQIGAKLWAFHEWPRLSFTMLYFPASPMEGDIDNIVKLTMDALVPRVYTDDAIVDRVLVQRFNVRDAAAFVAPSDVLLRAMAVEDPVLYIRIDEVSTVGVSL